MANSVKITIEGLDNFKAHLSYYSRAVKDNVANALEDAMSNIEKEAKLNLKHNHSVVTAALIGSMHHITQKNALNAVVGTDLKYAPYVEYGTAPHVIEAKNAKVLATKSGVGGGGAWIYFGKTVNHPGSHAKPFFGPAVDVTIPQFKQELKKALQDA